MTSVDKTTTTTKSLVLFFNAIFFVSLDSLRAYDISLPQVSNEASF